MDAPSLRLSPSKQILFSECERKFWHLHVGKDVSDQESEALVVGNVYHFVIAELLRAGTITELEPAVTKALAKYEKGLAPFFTDRQADFLFREVYEVCHQLHGEILVHLQPTVIEGYRYDKVDNFGYIIDCVSQTAPVVDQYGTVTGSEPGPIVLDWKIKSSLRHRRSDNDAKWSDQLSCYAVRTGTKRAAFVEIPRSKDARTIITQVNYTDEEFRRWALYHEDLRAAIRSRGQEKQAFKRCPRSNPLCSANFCPAWEKCYGKELTTPPEGGTIQP